MTSHSMTQKRGLIFVVSEPKRAIRVEEHAANFGEFTDTVSAHDLEARRNILALVSFDDFSFGGSFAYAALATRGGRVATAKHVIRFARLVDLDRLTLDELARQVPAARMRAVTRFAEERGEGVLSEKTWADVWRAVRLLRPDHADEFDMLERMVAEPPRRYAGRAYETIAQEKDAFLLATEIFGIERRAISRLLVPPKSPAPFLRGLTTAVPIEDVMIQKDKSTFSDWIASAEDKVGSVVLTRRDGRRLTVVNVNRTAVEETLGVDLIYYNHTFRSYVMVQYKRMGQEKDKDDRNYAVYRPIDESYKLELARIETYLASRKITPPANRADFRLSSNGFLFKLCPKITLDPLSTSPIKGMYLPLDYWKLLVDSAEVRGRRGGVKITYENVGRYFDNGAFVTLVEDGWLGSPVSEERELSSLIRSGLEGKRSVLFASASNPRR